MNQTKQTAQDASGILAGDKRLHRSGCGSDVCKLVALDGVAGELNREFRKGCDINDSIIESIGTVTGCCFSRTGKSELIKLNYAKVGCIDPYSFRVCAAVGEGIDAYRVKQGICLVDV